MHNSSPFAKEGYPFIIMSAGATLLLAVLTWYAPSIPVYIVTGCAVVITAFIMYFFRNPERQPPADVAAIVAPADGTVVVSEVVPDTPLGYPALKISIFMSVFNVHVNRVPCDGVVEDSRYHQGRFLDARHGLASSENERNCLVMKADGGFRLAVVQIAGLIARRIVSYPQVGDRLQRGKRYGLIRFGSRLDVYLPAEFTPLVKCGDTTVAGETVLVRVG